MGTVIRFAVVGLLIVAAAVGLLALGRSVSSPRAGATSATTVRTSFEPPAVQFGDPLRCTSQPGSTTVSSSPARSG